MCRFSIIIPVFRTEEYLDQCVKSVISQSFADFEIVLVDDGSPDGGGALCDLWAERDSRIHVIHQANGGLSTARNTGIHHAAGEYVLFLDSDDWWADDHVLNAVDRQLVKTPVDALSFNYRKSYDGVLQPFYFPDTLGDSKQPESIVEMMQDDRWVTGACNKAVRRSLLVEKKLYFRPGITSEDIDWTLRLALQGESFAFANICVFVYRQHASSISHAQSPEKVECLCRNVQECTRLLKEAAPEKAEVLKRFAAYQYSVLLHNVASLPLSLRSEQLMNSVREMQYLLDCSDNQKVRLLRVFSRCFGLPFTLSMLKLRSGLLKRMGKEV